MRRRRGGEGRAEGEQVLRHRARGGQRNLRTMGGNPPGIQPRNARETKETPVYEVPEAEKFKAGTDG